MAEQKTAQAHLTITDITDGANANIWTTSTAPTTPNYTFTISNLTGSTDKPRVGDIILQGVYRYTITSVSSTTVLAGSRQSLQGASGAAGGKWYTGTGITGTSTTATIFSGSGVSSAVVGDMYLNTSTDNTYRCTVAGAASAAKWIYTGNIKGSDGTSIVTTRELYYLKTNSTNPSQITWNSSTSQPSVTIYSDDRVNAWTSITPSYTTGGTYYTCIETSLSNSTKTWSAPVINNALTDANTKALEAYNSSIARDTEVNAIKAQAKHFWWDSEGAHIAAGQNTTSIDNITQGQPSTYTFNALTAPGFLKLRYQNIDFAQLATNSLTFYRPAVNGSTYVQGKKAMDLTADALTFYKPLAYNSSNDPTAAATLNSNGLTLSEGGIEAGTKNTSDYIYVWSHDDATNHTLNINSSGNKSDWRLVAGKNFGVDKAGNLYASNVQIKGSIEASSLTIAPNATVSGVVVPDDIANMATQEDIDNINIGAVNLFKDSKNLLNIWHLEDVVVNNGIATINSSGSSTNHRIFQMPEEGYWEQWKADTTYTISFDAKASANGLIIQADPYTSGAAAEQFPLTTDWKRYSYTFTATTTGTGSCSFLFYNASSGSIQMRKPKLEYGNKATDWTPALNDAKDFMGGRNLLFETPKSYNSSLYNSYQLNLIENLKANQTYTIQLWDVTVSHTGKANNELGLGIYWGGGNVQLAPMVGPEYFTNGHADHLIYTFTPTSEQANHANASNAWLNIYNSPPGASGTRSMSIGKWKLEYGDTPTDWTPSLEDVNEDISDASKVATNCITEISNTGIWVTPYNFKPAADGSIDNDTTGTLINSTGVSIYNSGALVANYGSGITLGQANSPRFLIESTGISFVNASDTSLFNIQPNSEKTEYSEKEAQVITYSDENDVPTSFPYTISITDSTASTYLSDETLAPSPEIIITSNGESLQNPNGITAIVIDRTRVDITINQQGAETILNFMKYTVDTTYKRSTDTTINSSKTYYNKEGEEYLALDPDSFEGNEDPQSNGWYEVDVLEHVSYNSCTINVRYYSVKVNYYSSLMNIIGNIKVAGGSNVIEINNTQWTSQEPTDTFYRAKNDKTGTSVAFGVGAGGVNHGVWSTTKGHWLIYGSDDSYIRIPKVTLIGSPSDYGTTTNASRINAGYIQLSKNGGSSYLQIRSGQYVAAFTITKYGVRGLYDSEKQKWIIYSPSDGNVYIPQKLLVNSEYVRVTNNTSNGAYFQAVCNSKAISLYSSTGGNRGIYDTYKGKWIIYSPTGGTVYIPQKLTISSGGLVVSSGGITSVGSINASANADIQCKISAGAGDIYLHCYNSSTGDKGVWAHNASGTVQNIFKVAQNGTTTFSQSCTFSGRCDFNGTIYDANDHPIYASYTYNGVTRTGFGTGSDIFKVVTPSRTTSSTGISFMIASGAYAVGSGTSSSDTTINTENSAMYLCGGSDSTARFLRSYTVYARTYTGVSANVYVTSSGVLGRPTSSSIRYKHDVEYITNEEYSIVEEEKKLTKKRLLKGAEENLSDILNIPVVKFKFNEGYVTGEKDFDYEKPIVGLIADDVAEIAPDCATYIENEDGEKIPESWNSDQLLVRMLYVVQQQEKRIQELENIISNSK